MKNVKYAKEGAKCQTKGKGGVGKYGKPEKKRKGQI